MTNLTRAFRALRRKGYFAKQSFWCCQTCAWAALQKMGRQDKAVFYHKQDKEYAKKYGKVYLSWAGVGQEIVNTLRYYGLTVEWSGNTDKRIMVHLGTFTIKEK